MLAYRHAFHAGNHADVLKHLVLIQVLRYMVGKDKPLRVIDTHAGAGGYSLHAPEARKTGEFEQGIARLWGRKDLPAALANYVQLVRSFNSAAQPPVKLSHYPGSPAIAQQILRPFDELRLYELHPTDHRLLNAHFAGPRNTTIHHADGYVGLKSELPPVSRRALVFMDPSYELAADYAKTVAAVKDGLTRFAQGVYVVWYPQVTRRESQLLPKKLQALAPKGWLHARLTVQQLDAQGFGLAGSGMFVINPPFGLAATLRECLPYLVQQLGQFDGASFLLDERVV